MSLTRNSKTDNCKGLTRQRERNKITAAPSETTHRGLSHLHLKTRSRGLLPERLSNLKSSNLKSHSSSFHRVMVTIPIARHSRKEMAHPHANTSCYRRLPHQRCSPPHDYIRGCIPEGRHERINGYGAETTRGDQEVDSARPGTRNDDI